jgi:hypothetical protein
MFTIETWIKNHILRGSFQPVTVDRMLKIFFQAPVKKGVHFDLEGRTTLLASSGVAGSNNSCLFLVNP